MKRHTAIVSDVHLSQAHPEDPSDPLWMLYRRRELHPDAELAGLVDHLLARVAPGDAFELVFNGDLLDFDAPWVKDGTSSFDEFPLDEEGCADQARRILADHQGWFRATARVLCAGHRVLFLSGNHDIELYWPGVRRAIRDELARLCEVEAPGAAARADLEERVRFRAWFHLTEDRIYLAHGSQYDFLNGGRHAMLPLTRERDRIHPVCGKLAFKRTGARMGYFNPYYEETFYMGLFGYLGHFLRFYARSHRHICRTWATGALRTALEIWRHRHDDERIDEGRAALRAELGAHVADEAIDATHALRARPAEETMLPILRELWVDRVAFAAFLLLAVGLAALVGGAAAAGIAALALVVAFVVYEVLTPKPDIRTYDSAPPTVLRLFSIHGARAICMGHTHRPFARWTDEGLYANSGSWAPAFRDQECTEPVLDARPLIWLTTDADALHGGLFWWREGVLRADPEQARPAPEASLPAAGDVAPAASSRGPLGTAHA